MAGGEHRAVDREDRSAAVMPPLQNGAAWRVVDLETIGERALKVRFRDGVEGVVRFESAFFQGVFAHLIDPVQFARVNVEMGAVTWPGELDLAPDRMHHDIVRDGICVLGAK